MNSTGDATHAAKKSNGITREEVGLIPTSTSWNQTDQMADAKMDILLPSHRRRCDEWKGEYGTILSSRRTVHSGGASDGRAGSARRRRPGRDRYSRTGVCVQRNRLWGWVGWTSKPSHRVKKQLTPNPFNRSICSVWELRRVGSDSKITILPLMSCIY
jgi:hypothetical protein